MESTREGRGLLDEIIPPRLEDAGLEDCALPPDSIQEAFLKAANAVKSRAAPLFDASDDEAEGGCVEDPWPAVKETETVAVVGAGTPSSGAPDMVVVGEAKPGDFGSCAGVNGGGELAEEEEGGNVVVVVARGEEQRSCGDGLKGLGVEGMNENTSKKDDGGGEEEEEEKQILVEAVV